MSGLDALNRQYGIRYFADGGSTADPIAGLYQSVLGRAPDAEGLAFWQGALASGQDLGSIESAFRGSQEFQGLGGGGGGGNVTVQGAGPQYDNAQPITPSYGSTSAIENWYQTNLGRQADPAGLQYWSSAFGATLDPNEIAQLQASPEYMNRQAVSGFYDTELGRKAAQDTTGLDYWAGLANAGTPLDVIRQGISGSSEGQTFDLNNLYQTELGRAPDTPGAEYWQSQLAAGKSIEDIQKEFNESKEGIGFDIGNLYEDVLGRKPDEPGLQFWLDAVERGVPREEILKSFEQAPEFEVAEDYQKYLGRAPDVAGSQYYQEQLAAGRTPQEIEREIALSNESVKLNTPSVRAVLEATLGKNITGGLTEDQIAAYTKVMLDPSRTITSPQFADPSAFNAEYYLAQNPDVAAAVAQGIYATPYDHYATHGFNEGRAPNAGQSATEDERLREVYRQIAEDPVLGPKLREENPMLWEKVTPLQSRPEDLERTERTVYGQYGNVKIGDAEVPILNARRADQLFGGALSGTISDFSHGRGRMVSDLGWSSNSFSGKLARGADALGVTVIPGPTYETLDENNNVVNVSGPNGYTGLNEAAKLLKIDPAQFKGNEDALYNAVSNAAKDFYLYTGDSLTPGQGREGGAKSFDTVLYQRSGDELIPISAPTSHGGMQNLDVYTGGSGFNFMRDIAPGIVFVGTAALAMATVGASTAAGIAAGAVTPATAVGAALGAGASMAPIVGGAIIGGAMGALSAGAAGGDAGKGAIAGIVTGGVANAMGPVLQNISPAIQAAADASGGLYTASQVANIVGSSFANAIGTAAGGASGDKILKSFGTALVANGISQGAVTGITNGLKDVLEPDTIAKIARASQIVSNTVATSALTGKNPEQIAQSLITQFTNPSNLISAIGSVATAKADPERIDTGGRDQGATGFTTGAVDAALQRPIIIDEILASSKDPIASLNAINNWTGDQQANIQMVTQDMLQGGFSKPQIVDNLSAIYQVDTPTASALLQGIVASAAIDAIANNSKDPIAVFNAATMATGSKEDNLKFITSEMVSQGLGKTEISKNLQDMYQIPAEKADAYAGQVLRTETAQPQAQNFGEAFSQARASGAKQFEYEGKKYTTELAPTKAAETESKLQAQQGAVSTAPSWSGLIQKTGAVPGLNSAVDAKLESTPFGPMPTSKAPSFYGQGAQTIARASTQQDISNFLNKTAPVQIDPANKSALTAVADFYKESLLGTGGQVIESIGNFRNYMAQVAVAHGIISPQNSFVLSSQAMQKFGDTLIPESLKQTQTQIVRDIDAADTVPGKIVAGLVSALENPRGASLFVGGALVEAGLPLIAGTAATAFTGLTAAGVGTMSLLQGAQSFGSRYEQVTKDLMNKGVPEEQAREQAMLPSYVSGLITAIVSPIANVPLIRGITSTPGTDIVLRNVTGAAAAKIVEKSVPVFMASSVSRDFASDYLDSLLGNIATDLIQTGTVNAAKYQSEAVLEGLIGVGANTAIKAPFAVASMIPAANDSATQQRPELKEYVIPQLEYTPTTETKAIGYTPQASPSAPVETVVDTRNTAAQDLLDNLDIDVETAVKLANNSVGSETINAMNSESSGTTPNINPDAVIVEDAFGNFITYADAIGAIVTESPIINTKIGTKEQQIQNEDLLRNVYGALNIDPQAMTVAQTQPQGQPTAFKEQPDISRLFNVSNLFPDTDLDTATQTNTAVKMSTETDTATATELAQKLATDTVTQIDLAIATQLVNKIQTAIDTATDIATKTQLQTDLNTATQIAQQIASDVRVTSPADTNVPADTDTNVNVDVNVPVTPQISTQVSEEEKKRRRRREPVRRRAGIIEDETGIYDLGPAFTRARTNYQLAGQFGMASGGSVASRYDPFGIARYSELNSGVAGGSSIFDPKSPFVGSDLKMPKLTVGTTKKKLDYDLAGYPGLAQTALNYAEGGEVEHNPQFFSEGGLGTLENRYVTGDGDGTSDEVPAMLANGEFVIPADVVAALGNGSNEAGASVLDQLLQVVREHRQDHDPEDLPPDSAGPLAYLIEAKKRA